MPSASTPPSRDVVLQQQQQHQQSDALGQWKPQLHPQQLHPPHQRHQHVPGQEQQQQQTHAPPLPWELGTQQHLGTQSELQFQHELQQQSRPHQHAQVHPHSTTRTEPQQWHLQQQQLQPLQQPHGSQQKQMTSRAGIYGSQLPCTAATATSSMDSAGLALQILPRCADADGLLWPSPASPTEWEDETFSASSSCSSPHNRPCLEVVGGTGCEQRHRQWRERRLAAAGGYPCQGGPADRAAAGCALAPVTPSPVVAGSASGGMLGFVNTLLASQSPQQLQRTLMQAEPDTYDE